MSLIKPAKLLPVRFSLLNLLPVDSNGLQYQFTARINLINQQIHSDSRYGNSYDLTDVNVGDYISTSGAGKLVKIVSIDSVTSEQLVAVVEDELRLNQLQDTSGNAQAYIDNGEGIIFEVQDGKPVLFPYTNYSASIVGFVKDYAAEIFSRFNYLRHDSIVTVEQTSPVLGATAGDLIAYDQLAGRYKLLEDGDKFIGVVVEPANPTSTTFRFNPVGSIVSIELPATQYGERFFYLDPVNPGKLTTIEPAAGEWQLPAFFKLDDKTAISLEGAVIENQGGDFVTLSTEQTITATKTFDADQQFNQNVTIDNNLTVGVAANIGTDLTVGGNISVSGDMIVSGTTTTIDTDNTTIKDQLIELNQGYTGPPMSSDSGIIINRGPEDNLFFGYDETANKFTVGTGTFDGSSTGTLTLTDSAVRFGDTEITGNINIVGNIQTDTLTDNRIVIVGPGGVLEDDPNLTWDGSTLGITGTGVAFTTGQVALNNASNTNVTHSMYVLHNTTADAIPTELFLDGATVRIPIDDSASMMFEADIIGRNVSGSKHCSFKLTGLLNNTSGTVLLANNVTETIISETTDVWQAVALESSIGEDGALIIQVTGELNETIKWVAFVKTTQIIH